MKAREIVNLIERIEYRHQKVWTARVLRDGSVRATIDFTRPDAHATTAHDYCGEVTLRLNIGFDADTVESAAPEWVMRAAVQCCLYLEMHEVYENVRLDGRCLVEPHPGTKGDIGHLGREHQLEAFFASIAENPTYGFPESFTLFIDRNVTP